MKYGLTPNSASPTQITSCDAVHSTSFAFQNSTVSVRNDHVYSFSDLVVVNVSFYTVLPCFILYTMSGLHLDQTWEMLHYIHCTIKCLFSKLSDNIYYVGYFCSNYRTLGVLYLPPPCCTSPVPASENIEN